MALVTVALLPHSPLLIPEVGRANYDFLSQTIAAYDQVATALIQSEVETIIVISPHGQQSNSEFIINVAPEMSPDFKDFGFIPSPAAIAGDAILADQIKNALRPDFPVSLVSHPELDYGSGVPLYLLKKRRPPIKTLVIYPPENLSLTEQASFGSRLGGVISQRSKKIALIASGDLSHRLKKKSPGGYSPKGAKFDNRLIELLSAGPSGRENILSLDLRLAKDAGECGLKPIAISLGLLDGIDWKPEILAYQTDFGIGYLSMMFHLPSPPKTEEVS